MRSCDHDHLRFLEIFSATIMIILIFFSDHLLFVLNNKHKRYMLKTTLTPGNNHINNTHCALAQKASKSALIMAKDFIFFP
jgi:hypothetical protein